MITRAGGKSVDKAAQEELIKLAEKGISDDEIEIVLDEYEKDQEQKLDPIQEMRIEKENYKKELSRQNFETGQGFFKRSR